MLQKIEFENPDKKPLGELFFFIKEDGVQMKIPALSERWVEPRCYTKYRALVVNDGNILTGANLQEWLSEASWFNKDVEYLLQLKYFRFWSHLVYDNKCLESIISFLQESTPYYFNLQTLTSDNHVIQLYFDILQNVLRVICRMITNKESEEEWIRNDHLKELLYSKFLVSIPMIFDLITAYGRSNITILTKIVHKIFKIEPKYNEDLKIGLLYIERAFKVIQTKTENEGMENGDEPAVTFDDLAIYTLDCACTLSILVEIYPEVRNICSSNQLEQKMAHFYDNTIPLLYKNIYTINPSSKSLEFINHARMELLKAFKTITYLYIENILKDPEQSRPSAESYIGVMTECLADRTFVVDYQKHFPIENDIDILKQACKDLDMFQTEFVLKAYTSECASYLVDIVDNVAENLIDDNDKIEDLDLPNGIEQDVQKLSLNLPQRDFEKEVTNVLDVLPHLGDGFIRRLLSRYETPEQVISAVLEGNLPPDLENVDQKEVYIPPDPQDKLYRETGIERFNIYDGDEYDIMTQDNPKCIIKTGKGFPGQPKNVAQLLDDKSHVRELKKRYQEYDLVSYNEYDDEYDDSYDALADSEAKTARSKTVQNVLVDEIADEETEEEDAVESDDENERDKSKDFTENPEVIRARYEAKRNAKYGNRTPAKNFDTVGKPKGQGQEKDVSFNRHKKDVNKSSRANHNRKSGASWKRNKGMIPS